MKRAAFLGSVGSLLLTVPSAAAPGLSLTMRAIARSFPGRIGVYARTMAAGPALVAYNAFARFPTASTIKVLIMLTAFAREERVAGTLSQRITFERNELIGGSDFMSNVEDGRPLTVRQLIGPMIEVSDNTAANLLIGYFGVAAINAMAIRVGMHRTHLARKFLDSGAIVRHQNNLSTPADMAQLLYVIERGARERVATIVSAKHCAAMISIMLGQADRDGIPAALPRGAQVANKTGQIEGTHDDIAIVEPFGDSPFVLAIMTSEAYDDRASYAAIHAVTRAAYAARARFA